LPGRICRPRQNIPGPWTNFPKDRGIPELNLSEEKNIFYQKSCDILYFIFDFQSPASPLAPAGASAPLFFSDAAQGRSALPV
jgi:hypothetical protein